MVGCEQLAGRVDRRPPADIAAELIGLVLMVGGIVALAHRAPQAARQVCAPIAAKQ